MKSSIRAALAVGALASSQAFASPVPVTIYDTVGVNVGMTTFEVGTSNFNYPSFNPSYYELNVGSSVSGSVGTYITLVDATPESGQNITYTLYNDFNAALGASSIDLALPVVDTWTFTDISIGNTNYTHFISLVANTQYVLKMVSSGMGSTNGSTSQVSAVPLPAAAWLFGSALLGLGALRRKQKANAEMAAA